MCIAVGSIPFFFSDRSVVLFLGRSFFIRLAAEGEGLRFTWSAVSFSAEVKVVARGDGRLEPIESKELPLTSGVSGGVCIKLMFDSLRRR